MSYSHQLSNGLYVSGRPQQPKEKHIMQTTAMPYIGGGIEEAGELGKMFQMHAEASKAKKIEMHAESSKGKQSGLTMPNSTGMPLCSSGPAPYRSSGFNGHKFTSRSFNKHGEPIKRPTGPQHRSPIIPVTGLITSGPISSGPYRESCCHFGPNAASKLRSMTVRNRAVTNLTKGGKKSFKRNYPKCILLVIFLMLAAGFIVGGFLSCAIHNNIVLIVVVILFTIVVALFIWNFYWGRRVITGFVRDYPEARLATAEDGQYIKISGVATCENLPLESSFEKIPRCVYTSSSLLECRGLDSKVVNFKHDRCAWGCRWMEAYSVDFYITDHHSGIRALVKTGYGAKVLPLVEESVVLDINSINNESWSEFLQWLAARNLSINDRAMRLKEGYIREGTPVTVMGVLKKNGDMLMIVPPSEPISTGWQWSKCIFPASIDGIVLSYDGPSKENVVHV